MNISEYKNQLKIELNEYKEKLDLKLNDYKDKLNLKLKNFKEKENKQKLKKRKGGANAPSPSVLYGIQEEKEEKECCDILKKAFNELLKIHINSTNSIKLLNDINSILSLNGCKEIKLLDFILMLGGDSNSSDTPYNGNINDLLNNINLRNLLEEHGLVNITIDNNDDESLTLSEELVRYQNDYTFINGLRNLKDIITTNQY